MRGIALLLSLVALTCSTGARGATAPDVQLAPPIEFPANEAGIHARAWFDAFNKGEEAMKEFFQSRMTREELRRRPMKDRLEDYRRMCEVRGKVLALEIEEFTASRVKVIARGDRGGRFAITFLCEENPPRRVRGIEIEDLAPAEGTPDGLEDAEYS